MKNVLINIYDKHNYRVCSNVCVVLHISTISNCLVIYNRCLTSSKTSEYTGTTQQKAFFKEIGRCAGVQSTISQGASSARKPILLECQFCYSANMPVLPERQSAKTLAS